MWKIQIFLCVCEGKTWETIFAQNTTNKEKKHETKLF